MSSSTFSNEGVNAYLIRTRNGRRGGGGTEWYKWWKKMRRRRREWLFMLLCHTLPLPVSILLPFSLQRAHVTLAIPTKQLPSLVAWLNFQSDPSHSHGNLIITSYKMVPFHLCLHFRTYNVHFTIQWNKTGHGGWKKLRSVSANSSMAVV